MTTAVSQPVAIGFTSLAALLAATYFIQRKQSRLPPGPGKLPLFGNLFDLPTSLEWETYAKWGKEYKSDIIHVNALGNSIVVLNSYEAAEELLDKRSSIYSSRPHLPMFHDLSGWGFQMTMLPYGDRWKASRRMFTQYFSPMNYEASRAREAFYTKRFLNQLLCKPDEFMSHIRHVIGGIAVSMAYGIDTKIENDPYIALVEDALEVMSELMIPGSFYVDALPFLKYLPEWTPGAYFHQRARIMRKWSVQVREETFDAAKKLIDAGVSQPSFVSESLRKMENSGDNEDEQKNLISDIANIVYLAAADTTASALSTFFLAMTCYPEIQKKAQAEVDTVVQDRLPNHDDLPRLPYLAAVIKETLRWATIVPMGLPHLVITDDVFKGYHIPANSIVIANLWAMNTDEDEYALPKEFIPERFICNGKVDPTVRDPAEIAFGFGRRACPGRHLALSTLMLSTASILSTFDLLKKRDEAGNEIEPKREYTNLPLNRPLPFPCRITPRSPVAAELIRSDTESP